jgi:DNA-binding MarR family transcriptional regulator
VKLGRPKQQGRALLALFCRVVNLVVDREGRSRACGRPERDIMHSNSQLDTDTRRGGGARSDSSLAKPLSTSFSESRQGLRREKVFGSGRCVPHDRNAKARIMMLVRGFMRRTEPGKAYGKITAKYLAVLQALLWRFHNCHSGRCFPSYKAIAEAAGCAPDTVSRAIKALEQIGVLCWVNRLIRVRHHSEHGDGWRWRVLRTSNQYAFVDPMTSSKSDYRGETTAQDLNQRKIASSIPPRWQRLPLWTEDERVFGVSVVPLGGY